MSCIPAAVEEHLSALSVDLCGELFWVAVSWCVTTDQDGCCPLGFVNESATPFNERQIPLC